MKFAGKLIVVSSILDCGCVILALRARLPVPYVFLLILAGSALLGIVGSVGLARGRRALSRAVFPAALVDLRLADAVLAAVPHKTELAVLEAIDTLNLIRTRSVLEGDSAESKGLQRDIDRVLEALQFQDLTRQMVESGLAVISRARDGLETAALRELPRMPDSELERLFEKSRAQLVTHAKTKAEKEALLEVRL